MSDQDESKRMTEQQEESKRISIQVSSLSTQLIESIDKQSRLEEHLNQAKKALSAQKDSISQFDSLKQQLSDTKKQLAYTEEELAVKRRELVEAQEVRVAAERAAEKLNKEIEDLTTSLFDEANSMVANARKEKHDVEVLNSKLQEQLREKDMLLDTLSIQLRNLKEVLYKVEDEHNTLNSYRQSIIMEGSNGSNASLDKEALGNPGLIYDHHHHMNLLFSPLAQSLRYDIPLYTEYLRFLAVLPMCKGIKDTRHDSKFLRRLVLDEIQPVLRLDAASGLGWLVRRNLMNLMIDGLVVVEPLSGINETYRIGYASPQSNSHKVTEVDNAKMFNYPSNSPPVAIQDPCAFCSESRNDILEHGRLYVLKTLQKNEDGSTTSETQYPLCHYCLLKVRQTCEIFAFLRSLKSGAWNLENVTLSCARPGSDEFTKVDRNSTTNSASNKEANSTSSKRLSFMSGLSRTSSSTRMTPRIETVTDFSERKGLPSTNVQRSWVHLCKLRASLHWCHIGVWTLEDSIQLKVAPMSAQAKVVTSTRSSVVPQNWTEDICSPQSGENFFVFQHEDGLEDEEFDFENGEKTLDTIKAEVIEQGISKNLENEAALNKKKSVETMAEPTTKPDSTVNSSSRPNVVEKGTNLYEGSHPVPPEQIEDEVDEVQESDEVKEVHEEQEKQKIPLRILNDLLIAKLQLMKSIVNPSNLNHRLNHHA
ncbi:guanine nucleotide exchange factor SEC2 Ecym_1085 [Eremothecium cymbalariae DBVPG|uniref:GDP/GTP exchange factor Sec2 N-terminal domain-containing protein n=1 Tax=Eremothecium cymbalariae (strain CBS 270.75 / DBVPG 7215 / KCTC 17166 / NRRL Y-17582) TaxID=931890 RepID=G8JMD3_ERECY|nr:hypothetical protein Ecym_1085 [Eremothecium cymbalariae DBVPG\